MSVSVFAEKITKNLKFGSTGKDVVSLQEFLIERGHLVLPPNTKKGTYGPLTKLAIVQFQKKYGIKPSDGIVGPKTKANINRLMDFDIKPDLKLGPVIFIDPRFPIEGALLRPVEKFNEIMTFTGVARRGDFNRDVKTLKKFLFCKNQMTITNTSALFDKETEKGLKRYQSSVGLKPTGILDIETILYIHQNDQISHSTYLELKKITLQAPDTIRGFFLP